MIRQQLKIEECGWIVDIFYSINRHSCKEAIHKLRDIGCPMRYLKRVIEKINTELWNYGVTYSKDKRTVIIISECTSDKEFMNTLEHEKQHLIGHIIDYYHVKPSSEDAGYLAGYIGAMFTRPIKEEICDCCKKKLRKS